MLFKPPNPPKPPYRPPNLPPNLLLQNHRDNHLHSGRTCHPHSRHKGQIFQLGPTCYSSPKSSKATIPSTIRSSKSTIATHSTIGTAKATHAHSSKGSTKAHSHASIRSTKDRGAHKSRAIARVGKTRLPISTLTSIARLAAIPRLRLLSTIGRLSSMPRLLLSIPRLLLSIPRLWSTIPNRTSKAAVLRSNSWSKAWQRHPTSKVDSSIIKPGVRNRDLVWISNWRRDASCLR